MTIRLTDAQGRVKEFLNGLHKFGASNPFTWGAITLVIGIFAGHYLWPG